MDHGGDDGTGSGEDPLVRAFLDLRERLLGTAWYVLGNREDAKEAVEEGFLKCWRRRADAARHARIEAWIFSVVLNAARDMRRRRTVRRADSLPVEDAMPAQVKEPDPAVEAGRREQLDRVRAALLDLPEAEREVFLLRQNGDLPFTEIAGIVGAPVGTVKSRMRLALLRLRTVLRPAADAAGRVS